MKSKNQLATSSKSKSTRGRKAPRMTKNIKHWLDKFMPVLSKRHGTHAKRIFHRLMKKSSTLRSTLKRRSKEYEVVFKISLPTIRNLLLRHYGKQCIYCNNILDVSNMVCDHIVPLSSGGPSISQNLEMICKRCNIRKGPLTGKEYRILVDFLEQQPSHVCSYVFRKLAGKELF